MRVLRDLREWYRPESDLAGAVVSGACAVHCVAMPLVAAWLPAAFARFVESPRIHAAFAGLVLATSLAAFVPGWLRHGESRIWTWVVGGLGLILHGRLADPASLGGGGEVLCTGLGGLLLVVAHRLNHSLAYWAGRD